ncbi:MAG: RNA-binding transcriptional accessory protein [Chloroflexi bacterium]|nr:RNA-binding transcriptional accessory protein [Chloroflexota bacterium]
MTDTNAFVIETIAAELGLSVRQVTATLELLDDDNTVPFIARYRKEVTGSLDEEQIRAVEARAKYLRNLLARKDVVLRSIEEQGKLTPELEARIRAAATLQEVEDLYLPYKPKRRTRATVAREKGLAPLADRMWAQGEEDPLALAAGFVDLEKGVESVEEALAGARDIVAETVAETAAVRAQVRETTRAEGFVVSALADPAKDPTGVYQLYYDYREPLRDVPPHRALALRRGERDGVLKVKVEAPDDDIVLDVELWAVTNLHSPFASHVRAAVADGYKRLIAPAIERELRSAMSEQGVGHAIAVFATNLRNLLMQPPLRGKTVLGIDPGFRTGCKVAVVDPTGKYLAGGTIYPHEPQRQWDQAKETVHKLTERYGVDIVSIGNGTASRETEALVAELIGETEGTSLAYVIVNEAGASVYSASEEGRREFPDLEAAQRGNVSIARRLQDPLAELVKIDPRSIGVGLYQHDVDQKALTEALDAVVESVVNQVGVDVNMASSALLSRVAGVNRRAADAIVKYREAHGPFRTRDDVLKVPGVGPSTWTQAAGFLRVPGGDEPLDNTPIHPETYAACHKLLTLLDKSREPLPARVRRFRADLQAMSMTLTDLAREIGVGEPTLVDMLDALERPGRDVRDDLPPPVLRRDVLSLDDLKEGMILKGTVRNVVDFGAFVDIGVKHDGLVHVSQMADRYVRNPHAVVSVGDIVSVRVIKVDRDRERIGLSMKGVPQDT